MSQEVMPKASPEAISLGGGLIVGGILESLDINYNMIISGTTNYIPSQSILRSVANKACEAAFMRISGFVCNYPCIMSYKRESMMGLASWSER